MLKFQESIRHLAMKSEARKKIKSYSIPGNHRGLKYHFFLWISKIFFVLLKKIIELLIFKILYM